MYFTVMKIHTDPTCPACGEEEINCHFLGSSSAGMLNMSNVKNSSNQRRWYSVWILATGAQGL